MQNLFIKKQQQKRKYNKPKKSNLNYYSRYNLIKQQDKHNTIPSLYSLFSQQTFAKLANDATISLQIINMYKTQRQSKQKEKLTKRSIFQYQQDENLEENEYQEDKERKSFINKQQKFRISQQSTEKLNSSKQKVHVKKKKNKKNKSKKNLKIDDQKKSYLEELQQMINYSSEQQDKQISNNHQLTKKQKQKAKNKQKKPKKVKKQQNIQADQLLIDSIIIKQQFIQYSNGISTPPNIKQKFIEKQTINNQLQKPLKQKQIIKSLLNNQIGISESIKISDDLLNNIGATKKKNIKRKLERNSQYVQSYQDDNQEYQNIFNNNNNIIQSYQSSIVIERVNIVGAKIQLNEKQNLSKQSKLDNKNQTEQKESQSKCLQKQQQKNYKLTKNYIELQFNTSQSEKIQPKQRNLYQEDVSIILKQDQTNSKNQESNQYNLNLNKSQRKSNSKYNPLLSGRSFSKPDELNQEMMDKVYQIQEKPNINININYNVDKELIPNKKSYNKIPLSYLSQINPTKQIQQAPFQHPLQIPVMKNLQKKQKININNINFHQNIDQNLKREGSLQNTHAKKTSFKKFMMNKQLNPRLVTSTIVHDPNNTQGISNNKSRKQFLFDSHIVHSSHYQQKINQNKKILQNSTEQQNENKMNFKKLMNKKNKNKQNIMISPIFNQNIIKPLGISQNLDSPAKRKLLNRKRLQAFFNQNQEQNL